LGAVVGVEYADDDDRHKPSVMYNIEHPAYRKLSEIGKEITGRVKPRAIVVFSAHWQAARDTIQVNTAEITDLIYECVDTSVIGWLWGMLGADYSCYVF
jgi:hypothetical protein